MRASNFAERGFTMAKKIAIVTGATGGLGRAFVDRLARKKIDEIWAVARDATKLEQLQIDYPGKIIAIPCDLSKRESISGIAQRLAERDVCVKYLVNNAGFAKFCSYADISVEESLNMIDLNVCAPVALGLECIPYMARGSRIINIASEAAFFPLPYMNIYSATKAFVRNYTRALNVELSEVGITATAVCPGWINTGLFERADVGAKKGASVFKGMVEPDKVARAALRDAKRGRDMSVFSVYVKTAHVLSKVVPQRVAMKAWMHQQNIK